MNQFDSPQEPELLSRSEVLRRGARLGGAVGALALTSAGWSSRLFAANPLSGTLKFLTYPGWIGKGEYAAFKKLYPKVSIKEDTNGVGSTAAIAAKIQTDPHAYDFLLLGRAGVPQLQ